MLCPHGVLVLCTHAQYSSSLLSALYSCSVLMLCTHALWLLSALTFCSQFSIIPLCLALYTLSFTTIGPVAFFAFPVTLQHAVSCEKTLVRPGL